MRNIILIISLFTLISCKDKPRFIERNKIPPTLLIEKFEYEQHDYIMFEKGTKISIIHNPECKTCYKVFD